MYPEPEIDSLFIHDGLKEFALKAGRSLGCKRTANYPSAKGASNQPANPSPILTAINSVIVFRDGGWTGT